MIKHINFTANQYVIVTGGNGKIKRSGFGLGFSITMPQPASR